MEAFCLKRIASSEAVYVCLLVEDDPYEMESGIQSVGQSVRKTDINPSVGCLLVCSHIQSVSETLGESDSQSVVLEIGDLI